MPALISCYARPRPLDMPVYACLKYAIAATSPYAPACILCSVCCLYLASVLLLLLYPPALVAPATARPRPARLSSCYPLYFVLLPMILVRALTRYSTSPLLTACSKIGHPTLLVRSFFNSFLYPALFFLFRTLWESECVGAGAGLELV